MELRIVSGDPRPLTIRPIKKSVLNIGRSKGKEDFQILSVLMRPTGFEPVPYGLKVRYSTIILRALLL